MPKIHHQCPIPTPFGAGTLPLSGPVPYPWPEPGATIYYVLATGLMLTITTNSSNPSNPSKSNSIQSDSEPIQSKIQQVPGSNRVWPSERTSTVPLHQSGSCKCIYQFSFYKISLDPEPRGSKNPKTQIYFLLSDFLKNGYEIYLNSCAIRCALV